MNYREEIVGYIEKIAKREGMAESTVCDKIASDAGLYARLKAGTGSCTINTAEKFRSAAKNRKTFADYLEDHLNKRRK